MQEVRDRNILRYSGELVFDHISCLNPPLPRHDDFERYEGRFLLNAVLNYSDWLGQNKSGAFSLGRTHSTKIYEARKIAAVSPHEVRFPCAAISLPPLVVQHEFHLETRRSRFEGEPLRGGRPAQDLHTKIEIRPRVVRSQQFMYHIHLWEHVPPTTIKLQYLLYANIPAIQEFLEEISKKC